MQENKNLISTGNCVGFKGIIFMDGEDLDHSTHIIMSTPSGLQNWKREESLFTEDLAVKDPNDQTIKADDGKLRLTLVPREIIRAIARARMYGLQKYGSAESWRSVSIERYRDAIYRHFFAYLDEPHGTDEESGLWHLDHFCCNAAFLCELEKKPE